MGPSKDTPNPDDRNTLQTGIPGDGDGAHDRAEGIRRSESSARPRSSSGESTFGAGTAVRSPSSDKLARDWRGMTTSTEDPTRQGGMHAVSG